MKRMSSPRSMSLRRLLAASCLISCLVAGCSPDDTITAPDEPVDALSPDVLASNLSQRIDAFDADLAAGRFALPKQPVGARGIQAANYSLTNVLTDNLNASALGVNCPDIVQIDQAQIVDVLVLDQPMIDAMNTALATAGGSVILEHKSQAGLSVLGDGFAAYVGTVITAVQHAAGGQTRLDQVQESQSAPPGGTFRNPYTVSFTASDVGAMAAGDVLVVAMLGVGGAVAGGCDNVDQAILEWRRPSGGAPIIKVRP